jgi:hypothetical protein
MKGRAPVFSLGVKPGYWHIVIFFNYTLSQEDIKQPKGGQASLTKGGLMV